MSDVDDNDGNYSLNERIADEPIDSDEQYERKRDDDAEEFTTDLENFLWKYVQRQNHYMNSRSHLITALRSQADYLEKYWKSYEEMMKNREMRKNGNERRV
jgi:hypothetical protein